MVDLRDTIRKIAPNSDPDEMLKREVLLAQMVEPEIGLLLTADGEQERQIILHVTGVRLPAVEAMEIDIALPTYFGARLGMTLMAFLLEEVGPPPPDPEPPPAAVVVRPNLSPYM